jgi:hypothetical protein
MAAEQVSCSILRQKVKNSFSFIYSPFIKQKFGNLTDASAIVS